MTGAAGLAEAARLPPEGRRGSLFLTLGGTVAARGGRIWMDDQTQAGMRGWGDNFDRVTAAVVAEDRDPAPGESPLDLDPSRYALIPLPDGYDRRTYLRERSRVRRLLAEAMAEADYRTFAIGGWIGDWGVEGAAEARRRGLPHAVWFDRVESQTLRQTSAPGVIGALKGRLREAIVARTERQVLRGADLGLLHGQTVFEALSRHSRNPHKVEDILTDRRIGPEALSRKLDSAATPPLRIVYAGRVDPMKGPLDWVEALKGAREAGVDFRADWLGDGPMLGRMRDAIAAAGLADRVTLHGFVAEADRVAALLAEGHLLLFCHRTDESPRILIEALHAGLPLIGYDDPFARRLVAERDAGRLVPRGDVPALVGLLTELSADAAQRDDLIRRAAASAQELTRDGVFAHRSAIIRQHLPRGDRGADSGRLPQGSAVESNA